MRQRIPSLVNGIFLLHPRRFSLDMPGWEMTAKISDMVGKIPPWEWENGRKNPAWSEIRGGGVHAGRQRVFLQRVRTDNVAHS
jgi:hypothetical protein